MLETFAVGACLVLGSPLVDEPLVGKWITTDDFRESGFYDAIGWELELYVNGRFRLLSDGGAQIQTVRKGVYRIDDDSLLLAYYDDGPMLEFVFALNESGDEMLLSAEDWKFRLIRTDGEHAALRALPKMPRTVDEAATLLIAEMSEDDRRYVETRRKEDLIEFHMGWGMGIRNRFGLWSGNRELLSSCGSPWMHPDSASSVIIEAVWERLREDLGEGYLAAIEEAHARCDEATFLGADLEGLELVAFEALAQAALAAGDASYGRSVAFVIERGDDSDLAKARLNLGFEADDRYSLSEVLVRMNVQMWCRTEYEPNRVVVRF